MLDIRDPKWMEKSHDALMQVINNKENVIVKEDLLLILAVVACFRQHLFVREWNDLLLRNDEASDIVRKQQDIVREQQKESK